MNVHTRTRIPDQDDPQIIAMGAEIFGMKPEIIKERLSLAEDVLLICNENDKLVGFLSYRFKKVDEFFIDMIAFDPFYQGRGITLALFPKLIHLAKSKGAFSIGGIVYKKNERVLRFLKHLGFRVKRYYVDTVYIEKVI